MAARASSSSAGDKGSAIGPDTRMLILHGSDRFLQDEKMQALAAALTKKHGADGVDTIRFDGQQGPRIIADVLDECRSCGLMQQHKVVVVDNADLLLKETDDDEAPAKPAPRGGKRAPVPHTPREVLENYAADASSTATLVLRAATWRPGNLDKAVNSIGAVIKCEPMSEGEAVAWAQSRAKEEHRTTIDAKAAAALVEATGTELGRIDTELEKLALAAGGEGAPITIALVAQMTGVTREDEFWTIQDALIGGQGVGATLAELRQLVEVSRHDPVAICWSYMEAARRVHLSAAAVKQGLAIKSLTKPLKIWGFGPDFDRKVQALEAIGRGTGPVRAAKLFDAAVRTDAANKSGSGEAMRNLEVLTVRFSRAIGGGAAPRR
jgi:DNA polymerase III delta subunit